MKGGDDVAALKGEVFYYVTFLMLSLQSVILDGQEAVLDTIMQGRYFRRLTCVASFCA